MSSKRLFIDMLIERMVEIRPRMEEITHSLNESPSISKESMTEYQNFLKELETSCGQFGFKKLHAYFEALSKTTEYALQVDNERAHRKVIRLYVDCNEILADAPTRLVDKNLMKAFVKRMEIGQDRCFRMSMGEFYSLANPKT